MIEKKTMAKKRKAYLAKVISDNKESESGKWIKEKNS